MGGGLYETLGPLSRVDAQRTAVREDMPWMGRLQVLGHSRTTTTFATRAAAPGEDPFYSPSLRADGTLASHLERPTNPLGSRRAPPSGACALLILGRLPMDPQTHQAVPALPRSHDQRSHVRLVRII